MLTKAIIFAANAHDGQLDKVGVPYILHPLAVMNAVSPDPEAMQVAVLHDVIEDCGVTEQDLLEEGFSEVVVGAVVALSREPAGTPGRRTYRQYVLDLLPNDLARKVKRADAQHNMSPDRCGKLPPSERGIVHRYEMTVDIIDGYDSYEGRNDG